MLYMLRELNQIIALREKVTNKYCRTVSTCRLRTTKSGDTLTSRIFAPFVSVQWKIIIQIDWIIQWIIGSESAFISSPQLDRFDEIVANIPSRLGEFLPTRASHHARVYNIWLSESNQVNNYIDQRYSLCPKSNAFKLTSNSGARNSYSFCNKRRKKDVIYISKFICIFYLLKPAYDLVKLSICFLVKQR
jgi:hypothetical protein